MSKPYKGKISGFTHPQRPQAEPSPPVLNLDFMNASTVETGDYQNVQIVHPGRNRARDWQPGWICYRGKRTSGGGRVKGLLGNKYRARKTVVDGITFDSGKEANRYSELKLLERAKLIFDLELQVVYDLRIGGQLICKYRADFRYMENGKTVVEDSKGCRTREYKIKKKLMRALLGVEILET